MINYISSTLLLMLYVYCNTQLILLAKHKVAVALKFQVLKFDLRKRFKSILDVNIWHVSLIKSVVCYS